jgi:hypothetical protein
MGPTAVPDVWRSEKSLATAGIWTPDHPALSLVTILTELSRLRHVGQLILILKSHAIQPDKVMRVQAVHFLISKTSRPAAWPIWFLIQRVKGKGFPLQASCGSWGSRRLRLLDRLDIRHYEGGKVVTLTHRPSLPPGVSWYSFLEAESTPGHMVPSVASKKISSDNTGDRSRDLPTSSAEPYPLRYPRPLYSGYRL